MTGYRLTASFLRRHSKTVFLQRIREKNNLDEHLGELMYKADSPDARLKVMKQSVLWHSLSS